MNIKFFTILITQIFILVLSSDEISLTITRSKNHEEKTGKLTPLVVSISSEDRYEKQKGVDLICIVDISGSMQGEKIELVRESLQYLVKNLMNEQDNFALVEFSNSAYIIQNLTQMNEINKNLTLELIDNLYASGGTNIYEGLEFGLSLLTKNYSSSGRIASMILLSDGQDNYNYGQVVSKFRNLFISTKKNEYIFTLHSFGFGNDHDAVLMNDLSKLKDGSFFFIRFLTDVKDAFLEIYGTLSSICEVNVKLTIQSNFELYIYGMDDMYNSSLVNKTDNSPFTFNTTILQFIYGKNYPFVFLVNIPEATPKGTEVLNATVSPFGKTAKYLWDQSYNSFAYEEYIRCISFTFFLESYNAGQYSGVTIMGTAIEWVKANYTGRRNWVVEYNDVINDLNNYYSFGKANLLSKIRELKSSKIGIHYRSENSYINQIIYKSHNIDVSNLQSNKVTKETILYFDVNINYYYFYLKDGIGEINNMHFSGEGSSIIIYSEETTEKINITSVNDCASALWNKASRRGRLGPCPCCFDPFPSRFRLP